MNSSPDTGFITVRFLPNIFNRGRRQTWEAIPNRPIISYAPVNVRDDPNLRVVRDGAMVHKDEREQIVRSGGDLTFYLVPTGLPPLAVMLIVSLVISGISFAVSALMAPSTQPLEEDLEQSATYGFDGLSNTIRPGTSIPIVYGTHRVAGHILGQFTRQARNPPSGYTDPKAGELHTLIGLCAGEIEAVDEVRVDKNPIEDYGETASWESRLGTNHQAPCRGFRDVVTPYTKEQALEQTRDPLEFETGGEVDAFEVVFRLQGGLYTLSDHGQILQRAVQVHVEYRRSGAKSWINGGVQTIAQRTRNAFDYWYESPRLARAQYQVRLTRITPDDTDATGYSTITILSLNDVTEETLTYPGLALLAVHQLPTQQVSGRAPTYDCLVQGRRVRVYSNTTTYTTAWSDNPAWCLLDYLTDAGYGLGAWLLHSQIDLQDFIDWADYCDTVVPVDSGGSTEKRFRLDMVVDGTMKAIDVVKQMCSTGMANFILRDGGQWGIQVEKADEPSQGFTMGRIMKGSFKVQKTVKSKLANYFLGQFWNQELDYEQDEISREDSTLLAGADQIPKTINLLGTTRASQANRLLNYYMLENRLSRRVVEFDAGVEALVMEAGDVFKLAHDVPGWGASGLISQVIDGAGTDLVLDRELTIESGKSYELTVIHSTDVIDVVVVTSLPGTTRRISVSGDWSTVPVVGADYSFGEVSRSTVLYRCTSITKSSDPTLRKVRARQYDAAAYGTDLTVLPDPSVSRLPHPTRIPDDVRDLRLQERQVYAEDGTLSAAIDVHFTLPTVPNARASVFWRRDGDVLWELAGPPVDSGYFSITQDIESPGVTYDVAVCVLAPSGNRRSVELSPSASITTVGTTRQPDNVSGFVVDRTLDGLVFRWDAIDPVRNFDLSYYEIRDGGSWETASKVGQTTDTILETISYVAGSRTFLIRAVNTAGKTSPASTSVVVTIDERIGENVVLTRTEETSWSGTKVAFVADGSDLRLDTTADVVAWRAGLRAAPARSSLIPGGFGSSFRATGSYTSEVFEVASAALRCLISTDIEVDQVDASLYWDAAALAAVTWDSDFARSRAWGVDLEGRVSVKVEMRFSTTTSADSAFGAWQERSQNIEALVRYAQVRVLVVIQDPVYTVKLKKLQVSFDVPDVVEGGTVTTSAVGTVAVTFDKAFNDEPKVAATVIGATAGDEIFMTGKDKDGFNIEVKNAGSGVVRTVNFTAVGY